MDGRGSAARFSERYPLLITETCGHTHFMMNFGGKPTLLDNPPLFKENLPKKGPLFREFGAQKLTHIRGTYPYPQHVMYPPPPGFDSFVFWVFLHDPKDSKDLV